VSCDPAGVADGLNLFAYAADSPTTKVDTSGLQATVPSAGPVVGETIDPTDLLLERSSEPVRVSEIRGFRKLPYSPKGYETLNLPTFYTIDQPDFPSLLDDWSSISPKDKEKFRSTFSLLRQVSPLIHKYAGEHNVPPLAIAGAIAWEEIVNPTAFTRPIASFLLQRGIILPKGRGVGLGASHAHKGIDSWEPDTVLAENAGLIPPISEEELTDVSGNPSVWTTGELPPVPVSTAIIVARAKRLSDPEWAIRYVAAIADMNAQIYERVAWEDIRNRPEILATLHNLGRAEKLAEEKVFEWITHEWSKELEPPLPQPNEFGLWTLEHRKFLEAALEQ
jgi:hypothetical protein